MQKFLGSLVGGGKKAVRELPKAAPASAPVLSGLAKQRQLEEAAIAKRGARRAWTKYCLPYDCAVLLLCASLSQAEVGDRAQNPKVCTREKEIGSSGGFA